ncbi:MAG: hypothetical protein KGJ62_12085 [Armatimonadetes bacterium]|nr:hypothetical protein [Armatimonadota bacterium]MDE2206902.1 hypothetical protein [Armatimonadota bacterium]
MPDGPSNEHTLLKRFRATVRREFGANLEKATPANVREFLDRHEEEMLHGRPKAPIELRESKTTYEEILKDFFSDVLDRPTDEAIIALWTLALEMSFFSIEQQAADRFRPLFGDRDTPP